MDKKTRTIIIVGSIITFLIVPVVATLIFSQATKPADDSADVTTPPLKSRSNDELARAIAADQPDNLTDENGEPNFVISKVNNPQEGWYIATMHFKYDTEASNPAKTLLYDQGEGAGLKVIVGPGTSFPAEVTEPLGIPETIAKELN